MVPAGTHSPQISAPPAGTTRGFGVKEFQDIGRLISDVLDGLAAGGDTGEVERKVKACVIELCDRFPIYG